MHFFYEQIEPCYFESTARNQVKLEIQINWQLGFVRDKYWWHLSDSYNIYDHYLQEPSHLWEHDDNKTLQQFYWSQYFQTSVVMLNKDAQEFSLQ